MSLRHRYLQTHYLTWLTYDHSKELTEIIYYSLGLEIDDRTRAVDGNMEVNYYKQLERWFMVAWRCRRSFLLPDHWRKLFLKICRQRPTFAPKISKIPNYISGSSIRTNRFLIQDSKLKVVKSSSPPVKRFFTDEGIYTIVVSNNRGCVETACCISVDGRWIALCTSWINKLKCIFIASFSTKKWKVTDDSYQIPEDSS